MSRSSPRVLVFDFDGVLADTEDLHWRSFRSALAGAGLELTREEYYGCFLGLPDRECLAAVCERHDRRLAAEEMEELLRRKRSEFARLAEAASLYDGVPETLRSLAADFVLGVASGAFRDEVEGFLDRAGVRALFAAVVGAEDVTAGKPAPDPFLRALAEVRRRCGGAIEASECLAVEDSPRGIEAAHAAGMACLAVTTSHSAEMLRQAEAVIDHVCSLDAAVAANAARRRKRRPASGRAS